MTTPHIPMSSPDLTDVEIAAVSQVLTTPQLSIGPQIEAFERAFASYVGADCAIGVNSGTAGLHLAVIAALQHGESVEPGGNGHSGNGHSGNGHSGNGRFDGLGMPALVITTPFSFIASANCILYERAVPIFVDVDPATGNIDPALVAEAAEAIDRRLPTADRWLPPSNLKSPRPARRSRGGQISNLKALLPVHAFGQPADMDPLLEVARRYNLPVVEDACEAAGAEYKGRQAGTLGDAAVFAFYPNKQMTAGEGGMIVTDKAEWADLFRSLRNQGRDVFDAWLNHTRLGYNYRLDEMSAALGLAQLGRIEELLRKRERVAGWYNARLAGVELIERPYIASATTRMSWFVYVVRVRPPADRDEVVRRLAEAGIPSRPYFTPIHLQPFYRNKFGYRRGDFPVTERLGDICLALPFSGIMAEEQVEYVCAALEKALDESAAANCAS